MKVDPDWWPKQIWDMWIMLLIVYSVITVPYRLAFDVFPPPGDPWWGFEIAQDVFFSLDIILSFCTAWELTDDVTSTNPQAWK